MKKSYSKKLSDDEAVAVMVTNTPAPSPTPKPTVTPSVIYDDLYGSWRKGSFLDILYLNFGHNRFTGEDDRFEFVDAADMKDAGTYELRTTTEWTEIVFITTDSNFCAGQIGRYRIRLTDEGELSFSRIEDRCAQRAGHITINHFVRD